MDKKNKIITAAISEFARNGFEKASMDAVALKAKVAKGTIFYHFKSKDILFAQIVEEGKSKLEKKIINEIKNIISNVDKIEKIIEIETDFVHKYRDLFFIYLGDTIKKVTTFGIIENVLETGVKKNEFRKNLNIKTTAVALFWLVAMTSLNSKNIKTDEIKDLALRGIKIR